MAAALTLCAVASGCVQPAAKASGQVTAVPVRVINGNQPFAHWQGAEARRAAEAECAARGQRLRTSIRDSFVYGAWVFPEGCA